MIHRTGWYSDRVGRHVNFVRWGHYGTPLLLFPTAGGDAEEVERMQLIGAIWPFIEQGRVKVYSCDSVNGQALMHSEGDVRHRTWLMIGYHEYVRCEVVPAIRADCADDGVEILAAGASIGAVNALAALCRAPDAFRAAICMSGTYRIDQFFDGYTDGDFEAASPLHILPRLDPDGGHLARLRQRYAILACGQGPHEHVGESWHMAHVLGSSGVPNRVDVWGAEWPHDWPTWRRMLPTYLDQLLP